MNAEGYLYPPPKFETASLFKMCFGNSSDEDQKKGLARTREIDNLIRRDAKEKINEVKLLLLGAYKSFRAFLAVNMEDHKFLTMG